jgi:hypothetical protein
VWFSSYNHDNIALLGLHVSLYYESLSYNASYIESL